MAEKQVNFSAKTAYSEHIGQILDSSSSKGWISVEIENVSLITQPHPWSRVPAFCRISLKRDLSWPEFSWFKVIIY